MAGSTTCPLANSPGGHAGISYSVCSIKISAAIYTGYTLVSIRFSQQLWLTSAVRRLKNLKTPKTICGLEFNLYDYDQTT